MNLEGKFCKIACAKPQHSSEMDLPEIRMLKWLMGKITKVRIRNECFCVKVEVDPIMDKMRHSFVMIRTTDPNHYDLKDPL